MVHDRRPPTKPQRAMLQEIAEAKYGVLYIRYTSRYERTIQALLNRGLVEISEPDYSAFGAPGWSLTAAGKALLAPVSGTGTPGPLCKVVMPFIPGISSPYYCNQPMPCVAHPGTPTPGDTQTEEDT